MNSNTNQISFNYNKTEQERKVCDSSYLEVVLYYCVYPMELLRSVSRYSFLDWVLIIMFIITVILFFQTLNYMISKIP